MGASALRTALETGKLNEKLAHIYVFSKKEAEKYVRRALKAVDVFESLYGENRELFLFSAPGSPGGGTESFRFRRFPSDPAGKRVRPQNPRPCSGSPAGRGTFGPLCHHGRRP